MPRLRISFSALVGTFAALVLAVPAHATLVQNLSASHHTGQTFLTWDNVAGTGWSYRVYVAPSPIVDDFSNATLLGEVDDSSSVDRRISSLLGQTMTFRTDSAGPTVPIGRGLFVATPVQSGLAYYAITTVQSGIEDRRAVIGQNATQAMYVQSTAPRPVYQRTLTWPANADDYVVFTSDTRTTVFPAMCSVNGRAFHFALIRGAPGGALLLQGHGRGGNYFNCCFGSGTPGEWVIAVDDYLPTADYADFYFGYQPTYNLTTSLNQTVTTPTVVADYSDQRVMYLLDWATRELPYDRSAVYATGASMGGSFAFFLAWHHADRIAGAIALIPKVCFGYTPDAYPDLRTSLDRIWGSIDQNLPTTAGPRVFQWMDGRAQADMRAAFGSAPVMAFCGTNDCITGWPEKVAYFQAMEQFHAGGAWFWDGRQHYQDQSTTTWAPMQNLKQLYQWRLDRSYPAFSNCSTDDVYGSGDPTTATPVGQLNGFVTWDPAVQDNWWSWDCVLRTRGLTNANGTLSAPASLTVDVSPRRLHLFTVAQRVPYAYTVRRLSDGAVLQTGQVTPDDADVLTVPQVNVLADGVQLHLQPVSVTGVGSTPIEPPGIQLSRNPVRDWTSLSVRWPASGPGELALYDAQGRLVRMLVQGPVQGAEQRVLSTDGLEPGLYLLSARQGSTRFTQRVAIVR